MSERIPGAGPPTGAQSERSRQRGATMARTARSAGHKGPDGEFEAALVTHVPALRRYALGLTRHREDADDLVHDCLALAIQKQNLWQPGTKLKSWLFTLLHNLFVNDYRKRRARPVQVSYETTRVRGESATSRPPDVTLLQLERALSVLRSEHREVVLLVSVQGFSYVEAAEIIDVPLGTIRSRLSRARTLLRRELGEPAELAAAPEEG